MKKLHYCYYSSKTISFKIILLYLILLVCRITVSGQTLQDTVAIRWQQFMAQLDTTPIESPTHYPIAEKLMAFAEKHYNKKHPNYYISLYHYGTGLSYNGNMKSAKEILPIGLAWMQSRQPFDTLAFAQWMTYKGNMLQNDNLHHEAIDVNNEGIRHLKNTKNPIVLPYLFDFYLSNGFMIQHEDIQQALQFTERGLALYDSTTMNHHILYALCHLSHCNKILGNYNKAIQIAEKTLRLCQNIEDSNQIMKVIAEIYMDMHLNDKGVQTWKKILENEATISKNSYSYGAILDNYAVALGRSNQFEAAFAAAQEALPIVEKYAGKNYYYRCCLGHVAINGAQLGKFDVIRPLVQELEIYLAQFSDNLTSDCAYGLGDLSVVYEIMGDIPKSIFYEEKTLEVQKKTFGKGSTKVVTSQHELIDLYLLNNQVDKCVPISREILQATNEQIVHNFELLDENDKEKYLQNHIQKSVAHVLHALKSYNQSDCLIQQGLYDALLAIKGVVMKGATRMQQIAAAHPDSTVQILYQKRLKLKRELGKLYSHSDSSKNEQKLVLEKQLEKTERELIFKLPLLEQAFQKVTYKNVQKALPQDAAAIEFIHFKYKDAKTKLDTTMYAALVLKPNQAFPEVVFLFEEKQLINILKNTYKPSDSYVQRGKKGAKNAHITDKISSFDRYKLIWQPLEKHLQGIKTIYYAPSGLLHQVSFALLKADQTTLLFDKYALNEVTSTREVLFEEKNETLYLNKQDTEGGIKKSIFLYGGIQYEGDSLALKQEAIFSTEKPQIQEEIETMHQNRSQNNKAWDYLSGTKKETEKIAKLFQKKQLPYRLKSGFEATEADFKTIGTKQIAPTVLHLATHGFFYPDVQQDSIGKQSFQTSANPLIRSGLVMAGANKVWLSGKPYENMEDGILTAYEISTMNLSQTKLVVMSACETGLGDIKGNEGVYGLQRAFKMAGVDYLLMSLWPVNDEATSDLMRFFYKNYLDGKPIRQAFQEAQETMKREDPTYSWAAFVLIR